MMLANRVRLAGFTLIWSLAAGAFAAPSNPPAPPRESPLAGPRKAVADAQAAVLLVHQQLAQVRGKVEGQFATRDDWVAAKKALSEAQQEYAAALEPVETKLHSDPEYLRLVADRKEAQAKLDGVKGSSASASGSDEGKSPTDIANESAGQVLSDGLALVKMENDAKENDPKLAAAKEKLLEAKKQMEALKLQVDAAMQSDPDYIALQPQITAADQQLAAARANLATAEKGSHPAPAPRTGSRPNTR